VKDLTNNATGVDFMVELTDAVVTYVLDNFAYIEDASAAVMVNFADHGLVKGEKINGIVTGTVKASNQIDAIIGLELSDATVTDDGEVPSASTLTLAAIKNEGTSYDGKLVTVSSTTVTGSISTTGNSGASIKDGSKIDESEVQFNIYAPNKGVEVNANEKGSFTGFVSIYNGSTYRINIYEQPQFAKTHNAPTAQALTFDSDAVELDEDTDDYNDFTGQAVSGAQGSVTYAITGDEIATLNTSTGAVTLNGSYGTATITATAAAANVVTDGVTTPYTATEKSYTVTVYPRYTVTFSVDGVETELREATHDAGVSVPTPSAVGNYVFKGWRTETLDATDTDPDDYEDLGDTFYPEDNDDVYYAVFALGTGTPVVEHTSTFTVKQASAPSSPYVSDGSSWTWSNLTFATDQSACINSTNGSITFTLPSGGKAKSLKITKTTNAWAAAAEVVLKDASSNELNTFSLGTNASATYNFTSTYDHSTSYTMTNTTAKNAWTDNVEFKYTTGGTTYSDYRTSLPTSASVTITTAKYATYCNSRDMDFSDTGIKVYKAKVNSEKKVVKLTEISDGIVPAGTGVILYKNVDANTNVDVPFTTTDATITDNDLVGTTARVLVKKTEDDENFNYILQAGPVFNMATAEGAYMPANRAYLSTTVDASASGARLSVVFDDDVVTGVTDVRSKTEEGRGEYFNLKGQRVENPKKGGIYVKNGKKVIFK
jgi:hypothetical protein